MDDLPLQSCIKTVYPHHKKFLRPNPDFYPYTAAMIIRPATLSDLPNITEMLNHYIRHTPVTFDIQPFTWEQRKPWFEEHSKGGRYRMLLAEDPDGRFLGYTTSGVFRSKEAYQTTVEVSIACHPHATGKGIGSRLYEELFALLAIEDVNRVVAGITQPNEASNALHQKFGFKVVGTFTEVGRKFGKYWDVLWLEKKMQ